MGHIRWSAGQDRDQAATGLHPDVRSALHQLAAAWRGDWATLDGSHLSDQLEALERLADGHTTLNQYRATHHLCPTGGGHWSDYCTIDCAGA